MGDNVTVTQEEPHQEDLSKQLFNDTDFTDVTLVCRDGLQLRVHRAVLCASNDFLRALLLESLQQNTFLYLGFLDHQVVEVLVEFVYLGRCTLPKSQVGDLSAAAKQLGVKLLEEAVERFHKEKAEHQSEISLEDDSYVGEGQEKVIDLDTFAEKVTESDETDEKPNFDLPAYQAKVKLENFADFKRAKLYERLPKIKIASPNSAGVYSCKK